MKKREAVTLGQVTERVAEELSDWFWGHRNADCVPEEAVKQRVVEIRRTIRTEHARRLGEANVWSRIISDVRTVIEQKHPGYTIIRIRGLGWKLSNDSEYADFTVGWAKRTFNAAARTMSLSPYMKRECIGPSVLKIFGTNEAKLKALAESRREFALTVSGWKREMRQNGQKQIEK